MSIYLDERNPGKHAPFEDAAPDIVEYVRYLEVIAGKSANTAFSYYCDLRSFSRFMKRRRGLVATVLPRFRPASAFRQWCTYWSRCPQPASR